MSDTITHQVQISADDVADAIVQDEEFLACVLSKLGGLERSTRQQLARTVAEHATQAMVTFVCDLANSLEEPEDA